MLYTRNHVSICRSVFFGVLGIAPFTAMAFLMGFPILLQTAIVALQLFGIIDVLVFFAYEDKLNDMFVTGNLRRYPRGCTDHNTIGFIMSLVMICLVGSVAFLMYENNFLVEHLYVMCAFTIVALLYIMSLCTLKAVIAYLVMLSTIMWLLLASFLGVVALLIILFTGCKVILGKRVKYAHEKSKFLTFG